MHIPRKPLLSLALALCSLAALAQEPQHLFFRVTVGPRFTTPVSGRLLVFLTTGTGAKQVDENPFAPTAVYVAAKEVSDLTAGNSVDIDTDDVAFPSGFSSLKNGDYQAQAVLDVNHNYNYGGRSAGDLTSDVVPLASFTPGQSAEPVFTLNNVVPQRPSRPDPPGFEKARTSKASSAPRSQRSQAALSTFARGLLRHPITIRIQRGATPRSTGRMDSVHPLNTRKSWAAPSSG